jgi:hypothetical protein
VSDLLDRVDALLGGGGEPDDVLREAVVLLAGEPGVAWAGVAFLEEGALLLGPEAGGPPDESRRARVPVSFQGEQVGELWVDGDADPAVLEHVASRLAAHVLIGWDTRGESWEP